MFAPKLNTRPIVTLCADDYGWHPAIDAAIIDLAQHNIIHATSCMSTAPRWPLACAALRPLLGKIDVGLHLNLTESFDNDHRTSLHNIVLRSYSGQLNSHHIATTIRTQLQAFSDALGQRPDMIDGHQHVHQLPIVRDALLDTIAQLYGEDAPIWIRNTLPSKHYFGRGFGLKTQILKYLGGAKFARLLHHHKKASNRGFAGVYGFDAPNENIYGEHMAHWLNQAHDGLLIMCHPANAPIMADAIGQQRPIEFRYLSSPAFTQLCEQKGIVLGRLNQAYI
ncbi:MAG: ChbG/HpnK family deacetylase [Ottowia sp.]|nr:ChbG/HpnK family deacetylase [Ottowia sp.]